MSNANERNIPVTSPVLAAGIVSLAMLSGCAAWREQFLPEPNVSQQRVNRQADVLESFEQHRDEAQLQAALDRWQQGDIAGCESRLRTLLDRRPDFHAARLRLAELAWSHNDAPAAEQHYRQVLASQANHAEAQHGLGMLYQSLGRFDEAARHLQSAAQLDPENQVYGTAAGL